MKQRTNPLADVKVEVRRSPTSLKIVLILLIVFSTAALVALRWVHLGIQAQTDQLTASAAAVEYANRELERKIEDLGSVQSIQRIAQEELGLVSPDTIIVTPNP